MLYFLDSAKLSVIKETLKKYPLGGVTAVTVTAEMLDTLSAYPGTDKELASFEKNWSAKFDKGIAELIK